MKGAAHRLANFIFKKPEPIVMGKRWRGFLASFLLPGAGQFFQGRRVAAAIWILVSFISLPVICLLFAAPFISIWFPLGLILLRWIGYILAVCDACRPTGKVGWKSWLAIVIIAVILIPYIQTRFLCRIYRVSTPSMEQTIQKGDQVFCLPAAYRFFSPHRGDVIAFSSRVIPDLKGEAEETFVKRLVGLPGDVLKIKNDFLFVNGVAFRYTGQQESYSSIEKSKYLQNDADEYVVPNGMYFVLGDHPPQSYDSRFFGAIPSSAVRGKVEAIILPVSHASRLR